MTRITSTAATITAVGLLFGAATTAATSTPAFAQGTGCGTTLSAVSYAGTWSGAVSGTPSGSLDWVLGPAIGYPDSALVKESVSISYGKASSYRGIGTYYINGRGIPEDLLTAGPGSQSGIGGGGGGPSSVTYTVNSVTCTDGLPVSINVTSNGNFGSGLTYTLDKSI